MAQCHDGQTLPRFNPPRAKAWRRAAGLALLTVVACSFVHPFLDHVWVMFDGGTRLRMMPSLASSGFAPAIPLSGATWAISRTYCDLDIDDDDERHIIATVDEVGRNGFNAYVYRQDGAGGWDRVLFPGANGTCLKASWDAPAGDIFVLDSLGDRMHRINGPSMSIENTANLSAVTPAGAEAVDIAAGGGHAVLVVHTNGSSDALVAVDQDGNVEATTNLDVAAATYLTIDEDIRAWWTGLGTPVGGQTHALGYFNIEG